MLTNRTFIILASLAMLAGLASCQKPVNDTPVTGNVTLTFGFEDTKVSYTETGSGNLHPEWENGDVIVGQTKDGSSNFSLTVTSVSGGTATVTGDAPLDADVCLVYLKGMSSIGSLPDTVRYSNQGGDNGMPAVMLSNGRIDKDGKGNFTFSGAGAVIGIDNAKGVPAGSAISKVTISGNNLSKGLLDRAPETFTLKAVKKEGDAISTGILSGIAVTENDSRLSRPVLIAIPDSAVVTKVTLTVGRDRYFYTLPVAKTAAANSYLYVKDRMFIKNSVLPGKFSVSATKKVYFSRGNLQAIYNGSGYDWDFAVNQYDYVGNAPGNTTINSQTAGAIVDLFGWSTKNPKNYFGISTSDEASDYSGEFLDWSNAIIDTTWHTLTGGSVGEWDYLLKKRSMKGPKFTNTTGGAGVTIEGVAYHGLFIYPDDYSGMEIIYSGAPKTWAEIDAAGIVFLPAAGTRMGSEVSVVNSNGLYWSSTLHYSSDNTVYDLHFSVGSAADEGSSMDRGCSVRLVKECK